MAWRSQSKMGLWLMTGVVTLAPLAIGVGLLAVAMASKAAGRRHQFRSADDLKKAILGSGKRAVIAALGPPRTAMVRGYPADREAPPLFQANTWYYPVNERERAGMAVVFDEDKVKSVEFF